MLKKTPVSLAYTREKVKAALRRAQAAGNLRLDEFGQTDI